MDLLIPSTGLLFWMTITFLVVFFILWKFGFPVITGMVKERQAFIDDSLRKAHEANERLANIQKEGESILQEAREKQAQILKEAAETRDAIVEKAQDKARAERPRRHRTGEEGRHRRHPQASSYPQRRDCREDSQGEPQGRQGADGSDRPYAG